MALSGARERSVTVNRRRGSGRNKRKQAWGYDIPWAGDLDGARAPDKPRTWEKGKLEGKECPLGPI